MDWLTSRPVYDGVVMFALAMVPLTVIGLRFMSAPYGRFNEGAKLALDPRLGWFLMELPATLVFWTFYLSGPRRFETVPLVLAGLWGLHYANRGFVFPALMRVPRGAKGTFGWLVIVSGWGVTAIHGYLNGVGYSREGSLYDASWLTDPRFVVGVLIYGCGLALNIHSDAVLRSLRSKDEVARGEKHYRIPNGGLYRWVTNPSYLGELVAWAGFACFTWSWAGVFIFSITAANLVPRAISNHRWYREKFADYPPERRVLVPHVF